VKHKESSEIYAMKVMKKHRILEKDHSEYVKAERDVLTAIIHPFIVTMRSSFQVGWGTALAVRLSVTLCPCANHMPAANRA
jgi:serine/threonine protein kinase